MHRTVLRCYTGRVAAALPMGIDIDVAHEGEGGVMGSAAAKGAGMAETRSMPLRIAIYLGGILILGVGVVLSARSDFGAPAFQSVPLVFSEATHLLTLGQSCICLYSIDVLIQVLVFRTFNVKIALQIPFAFVFGCLIDAFDYVLALDCFWFCHDPNLLVSCIMFTIGITLIGIGVSAMVAMDFVLNPADGCTQAFMKITHLPFGKAKIINDVLRFSLACVMALALTGHLFGVGIGTVISMFAIGAICQVVSDAARGFYQRAYVPAA